MADWSLIGDGQDYAADGRPVGGPWGVTVTTGNTPHTKGAWAALAGPTYDCSRLLLHLHGVASVTGTPATAVQLLVDVGVGSPGNEVVLVPDLYWVLASALDGQSAVATALVPVPVPAGTAVSVRAQASTGTPLGFKVSATYVSGGWGTSAPNGDVEAWGVSEAGTAGVTVTPGSLAWGSYAALTASSSFKADHLVLGFASRGSYPVANATHAYLVDVAVGALGQEQTLVAAFPVTVNQLGQTTPFFTPPLPVSIPAGSRVAVRAATSTGGPNLDVVAYAVGG